MKINEEILIPYSFCTFTTPLQMTKITFLLHLLGADFTIYCWNFVLLGLMRFFVMAEILYGASCPTFRAHEAILDPEMLILMSS